MHKGVIQRYPIYCDHLGTSERDREDVSKHFYIRKETASGLEDYIKDLAFLDESNNLMRTYLVRACETDELVGYFSLKAGLISGKEGMRNGYFEFETLPGVELANFAVNSKYIDAHPDFKGIGAIIFSDFILPIIERNAKEVGIKVVYIFSLPFDSLIHRYEDYGFRRLDEKSEKRLHARLKPAYDKACIFMYQPLP